MDERVESGRGRQRGMAAVEFALIAMIFFGLIFAIVDFGRWLFAMNAAAEATRWGARLAAVCDVGSTTPKNCMKKILPGLTDGQIAISYTPDSCDASNCTSVAVQINGMTLARVLAPQPATGSFLDMPSGSFLNLPIGSFPTRLTREMMVTTWVCDCP